MADSTETPNLGEEKTSDPPPPYSAVPATNPPYPTNQSAAYPPTGPAAAYPPANQPGYSAAYPPLSSAYPAPAPGTGYGQPGAAYVQPYPATTTGTVVQPTTTVVVTRGADCPMCHNGFLVEQFTCCGIFLAIFFFPLGIICCLAMRIRVCSSCGAAFG